VTGVVAVVVAMAIVFTTRGPSAPRRGRGSAAAIAKATQVPPQVLARVGIPAGVRSPPALPVGTPAIEADGRPVVLYVGAEYCPYCAAERWPVVVALSRFGTFTGLGTTTSASRPEPYPGTATFTFSGATYTSDHLVFSSVETASNTPASGGGFTHLQDMTAEQQRLFLQYDTTRFTGGTRGGIPFVMIGNRSAWAGASYDPGLLAGQSFDRIANQLHDPTSPVAQAIDGSANQITAMICLLTGNQPLSVCSEAYIRHEQTRLAGR
jgi:Domain of unknown function (DUF929)